MTGKKIKAGAIAVNDLGKAARKAFTTDSFYDELEFHNISSGDPDTTIFEFTAPRGAYLVSASANIANTGGDVNDFTCKVTQPIGEFARTIATSEVRVANGGDLGTISLDGIAVNTKGPIVLTMTCEGQQAPYAGKVLDPRIVAVEVGTTTQK